MRSNLYITMVLLMLAFVPACAVHLTGRVLSPSKILLSGAAVSLCGTGLRGTTGDSAYVLPVNEHWSRTTVAQDAFGGCAVEKTETRTITNFGFLTNEQLKPYFK